MATTGTSSELFRFASQRAIQTADPVVARGQSVRAYLDAPNIGELHSQLVALRPQPQARARMAGAAADFVASANFVRDRDEAGGLRTAIRAFAQWLQHAPVPPTYEEVRAKLNVLFGLSGSGLFDLVNGENFRLDLRNIIDSLIAVSACCARRDARSPDYLVQLLRACRLIQRIAASDPSIETQAAIQAALRAPALLPPDVFPLPIVPGESSATPPQPPAGTRVEQLRQRLAALETAYQELRAVDTQDFAVPSTTPRALAPTTPPPPAWVLSADAIASKLSATTRALFDEAQRPLDKTPMPQALVWLESELPQTGLKLYNAQLTSGPVKLIRHGQSALTFRPAAGAQLRDASGLAVGGEVPVPEGAMPRPYIGMADLLIVEQDWNRYEEGEIAHIENVLRGEYKQRVHRRLNRVEETVTVATERTAESERDTQSTERFELKQETSETIKAETKIDTGVEVSGSYGPVTISTKLGASFGMSYEQSEKTASTYAREVTDRAKSRVEEKVREERVRKVLEEIEETNTHGVDNKGQADHVIGMYRWLDKVYCARLVNYGRRALFEFIVPEPAAYYLYAMTNQPPPGVTMQEPPPPIAAGNHLPVAPGREEEGSPLSPNDLYPSTYMAWISRYQVADIKPYPKLVANYGVTIKSESGGSSTRVMTTDLKLPDTYVNANFIAKRATITFPEYGAIDDDGLTYEKWLRYMLYISVGQTHLTLSPDRHTYRVDLAGESESVPIAVKVPPGSWLEDGGYAFTVEVMWERVDAPPVDWQLETYNAIMRAYQNLKSAYDQQVAAASVQEGISISGRNPLLNRGIEQTELKKAVLSKLTQQYFTQFDATRASAGGVPYAENGVPYFDFAESDIEGEYIQFFEQAFEWSNMTYSFYPYFWGRTAGWREKLTQIQDVDPLFENFLKAGAARVVVPARPGYETALGYFLQTGCIWNGGDPPLVDDELYVSMIDDLRKPTGELLDTWEIRVPTSLVRLQPDASLPAREPCPTISGSDGGNGEGNGEGNGQGGEPPAKRCRLLEWLRSLFGGEQ